MFTFSGRDFAILAVAGLLAQTAFAAAATAVNSTDESVEVQIIALNDLHGQLEPPSGSVTLYYNKTGNPYQAQVGGIEYLATQVKGLKATIVKNLTFYTKYLLQESARSNILHSLASKRFQEKIP